MINPLLSPPGPFRTINHRLFAKRAIRDTEFHDSNVMVRMDQNEALTLQVFNTHDEELRIFLVGAMGGGFVGATNLGSFPFKVVPAKLSLAFSVNLGDLFMPWIGIRAHYPTAPTEGNLVIFTSQRQAV